MDTCCGQKPAVVIHTLPNLKNTGMENQTDPSHWCAPNSCQLLGDFGLRADLKRGLNIEASSFPIVSFKINVILKELLDAETRMSFECYWIQFEKDRLSSWTPGKNYPYSNSQSIWSMPLALLLPQALWTRTSTDILIKNPLSIKL